MKPVEFTKFTIAAALCAISLMATPVAAQEPPGTGKTLGAAVLASSLEVETPDSGNLVGVDVPDASTTFHSEWKYVTVR